MPRKASEPKKATKFRRSAVLMGPADEENIASIKKKLSLRSDQQAHTSALNIVARLCERIEKQTDTLIVTAENDPKNSVFLVLGLLR